MKASGPLAPDAALATVHVPAGFRVELVASEPLVMDPVAFDWDAEGRLWVAEMRDYPNGMTWNQIDDPLNEPGGSIKVLTDTDGDGRYDKADLFLDGLPYPTGVKVWDKGVLITAAPEIFYAEDTDGDGRADRRETWYSGFAKSNQQHRVNGLAWGLDNWLHVANGDGGGVILSRTTRDEVDIRGLDLRIDPFTRKHEPLSGRTQCGRYRDDWGNWFGCNNSNPVWHYPMRWNLLQRNPDLSPPAPTVHVPEIPGAAPVYPVSRTETRFNQPDRANRFTSVCGPNVYRDSVLGEELRGNIFICEPVHNLVSRQVPEVKGATFTSARHPSESESEFFASTDSWSRPVAVRTGPDGAIWIADMYRAVIEHPEWIPIDRQKEIDIRAGHDLGRIYRIVPEEKADLKVPVLSFADDKKLAAALNTENGTVRDLVHQMLIWRGAKEAGGTLEELAKNAGSPEVRLQSLCVLDGLGVLNGETIHHSLTDPHPGVVRHAVRLSPGRIDEATLIRKTRSNIGDPFVAIELAAALHDAKSAEAREQIALLLMRYQSDPHVTAVALSSVNRENLAQIAETVTSGYRHPALENPSDQLARTIAGWASKWNLADAISPFVEVVISGKGLPNERPRRWQLAVLRGLLEPADDLKSIAPEESQQKAIVETIGKARDLAAAGDAPLSGRLEATRLLACKAAFEGSTDIPLLVSLLETRNDPTLRETALEALAGTRGKATATALIQQWKSLPPTDRSKVQNLLLGRSEWAAELVAAVESGTIPRMEIDAAGRSRLMKSANGDIRQRAKTLFAGASNPNRGKVLADWKAAAESTGDAEEGKQVFAAACIACHEAEGQGNSIGPDLAAITDRSREALLVAILDPNRAVEDKFLTWNVKRKNGSFLLGLVTEESANDFTLRGPDGSEAKVLRTEIESMESVGVSLMPEGLEATMTKQQMSDLISYVASLGQADKSGTTLSARVRPGAKGVVELRASKCRIDGDRIEYMPDFDALGWWTSQDDRAEWTVVLDRPGRYRVEWEYSVSPKSAGNNWQIVLNGEKALGGTVKSTGSWEAFRQQRLGEIDFPAADNSFVIRSEGPVENALLDLRWVKLVPVGERVKPATERK
ncbi:MAG: c-type cytochrome [Verrucomicrobiales bacterium]|nr:c-type cytochrome [Verrucomicrobiales bacterium]